MPLLAASLLALSLSAPLAEPRVLHVHRVTSWMVPELDEATAHVWRPGSKITVWPVACDQPPPKVDFHATFAPPGSSEGAESAQGSCVPARLFLPAEAVVDDGTSARDFMKLMSRCWKTTTEKAPDAVVRGLEAGELDVMSVLAARTTPTVLVIARRMQEAGLVFFSVEVVAGPGPTSEDGSVPGMPMASSLYDLAIVEAPRAREVTAQLSAGRAANAVKIARAGVRAARGKRSESLALANLAVAALMAGDRKAVPLDVQWREDDATTDAEYRAQDSWSTAAAWARGELDLVADPCR